MEYTKGEWKAYLSQDGTWYIITPDKPDRPHMAIARLIDGKLTQLEANARLIAAAPDMYEALKELTDYILEEHGLAAGQFDGWVKARRAIKEAEGK